MSIVLVGAKKRLGLLRRISTSNVFDESLYAVEFLLMVTFRFSCYQ